MVTVTTVEKLKLVDHMEIAWIFLATLQRLN